jgi:hypothetical protein
MNNNTKNKIDNIKKRAKQNEVLKKSVESLKPNLSIWGFLGIVGFFILPEIIGFAWGVEIASWAHAQTLSEPSFLGRKLYWLLEILFEDGGSYVNLTVGILLLYWLFYEWKKGKTTQE